MPGSDHDRTVEQFEARLRSWGGRPPSLDAAIAANHVLGQLPERGAAQPWLRLAAVTAMLALIAVTTWVAAPLGRGTSTSTGVESSTVVQFWLDSETPVYFILAQFGPEEGKTS